jgi:hypothetical protein
MLVQDKQALLSPTLQLQEQQQKIQHLMNQKYLNKSNKKTSKKLL